MAVRMEQSAKMPALRLAGAVESTGTYTARALRTPKMAVTVAKDFGAQIPTRSPGRTPWRANVSRSRSDRAFSSP
jgi:hypothetical protein